MKKTIFNLVFAAATIFALANCAKSDDSNNNGIYGNCAAGQVYTQYGCLNQGNCQYGQGLYGNQCIQGTINNGTINNGMCGVGQVYANIASAGMAPQGTCLPQGACAQLQYPYNSYGFYNGYCYPPYNGGNINNQCGVNMSYINGQCVYNNNNGSGWLY